MGQIGGLSPLHSKFTYTSAGGEALISMTEDIADRIIAFLAGPPTDDYQGPLGAEVEHWERRAYCSQRRTRRIDPSAWGGELWWASDRIMVRELAEQLELMDLGREMPHPTLECRWPW